MICDKLVGKRMKIVFFGASVTQQKNGYVDCFKRLYKNATVIKRGYGGMHLSDAGICFLDNVVKLKPEICFIDWFSTGYCNQDGEVFAYIDTILHKLGKIDCRVIFLTFPYFDTSGNKKEFYKDIKEYLKRKNAELITVDEEIGEKNYNLVLRDNIHTTPLGGQKYAESIYKYLMTNNKASVISDIESTKYSKIKRIKVRNAFADKLVLNAKGDVYVIGMYGIVGRHSGILEIRNGEKVVCKNIWEQWCHYSRKHFYLSMPIVDKTEIVISEQSFDTSACKKKVNFDVKKMLVVDCIYYIGEDIELSDMKLFTKMAYWKKCAGMYYEQILHILGI